MTFRHIDEVLAYPSPVTPRCAHRAPDTFAGCDNPGALWLVSEDGWAICVECEEHANATITEYHTAAGKHPALEFLAKWRAVPVVVAVQP